MINQMKDLIGRKLVACSMALALAAALMGAATAKVTAAAAESCAPAEASQACAWSSTCGEECVPFDCTIDNCVTIQRPDVVCIKCMDVW